MKETMTTRERFQALLNFEKPDRLPVIEWAGWWDKTINRWESEGMPSGMDRHQIMEYFGLDLHYQNWIRGISGDLPQKRQHYEGLILNEDDYEKILPHIYQYPTVDTNMWTKWAEIQKQGKAALWFSLDGFFWFPRVLFGVENHLYAFYDHPELMHRINRDLAEWILKIIDDVCKICIPDFMTFAEDMSYNHGSMLSKELFDEFLRPYYQMVVPRLNEYGIKAIIDSDGNIHQAAKWFEQAGLDGILPLERQAGVDMAKLRVDHPDMLFIGAYDKMVMNKGEAAMRSEFERLIPVAKKSGFIISCDHQTPPGVSLEDYKLYVKLFREYAF